MDQSTVIQNIIKLLKEQEKTQKNLTDYLGITQNAFTDWKSGRIKSYTKHLPKIADYFGVSVDYLLGNETQAEANSPTDLSLTEGEQRLLEVYRKASDDVKPVLVRAMESLESMPLDKLMLVAELFGK